LPALRADNVGNNQVVDIADFAVATLAVKSFNMFGHVASYFYKVC